jgi:AcrR family transcriptional regulator
MVKQKEPSKGERTRKTILDSAYGLITEQGYAATSMRQIAEKAGLSLGSIYNHFPSKQDVFKAIVLERHPMIQIIPLLGSIQGRTVDEFVQNAAHALIKQLGRHQPELINLMLTEIVEFKGAHMPLVFEKMVPRMLQVAERLSQLDGELRPIPRPIMLRAFAGTFLFYYVTESLLGPAMPPEMRANALDHFVDIYLHGILVKETA